ncbi:MAG: methionyl-tRNA formyltransferase [Rhodospirillales bacterium]|jgi:methionyl-tRNA formyltransferase
MRLIVMGQQAFGKSALEAILEKGEDEVVAVYCAPDKEGKPVDPIKTFAEEKGLPVYQPDNFKDAEYLDAMRALNADLCVMAYVIIFVPEEARDIPTHGSICFHPSILPKHRGPSSINWPIIGGATKSGLTFFWPDDGLDEGEILLQKHIDITPDDTLGTVYFEKIFPLGIEATLEAIALVKAGNPPRIVQDSSLATYESWCRKADAEIDWFKSSADVYNLIRGTNPQPGSWTTHDGNELKVFDCAKVEASGKPGEVVAVSDEGITVATKDGGILVKRVKPHDDKKITSADYISKVSLTAGVVFG